MATSCVYAGDKCGAENSKKDTPPGVYTFALCVMANGSLGDSLIGEVSAFGDSLFACPKSKQKGHASLNAPQGKRKPTHNNLYY
jgi:hypothetical protein